MKRIIALALLMCTLTVGVQAQHRNSVRGLFKVSYNSKDPGALIHNLQNVAENPSVDFLRNCNASVGFRVDLPLKLYLQAEGVFSINAVWDSVALNSSNFVQVMGNTVNNIHSMGLSIPVYAGWYLLDVPSFGARVFAGPEFYTTMNSLSSIDFNTFSFTAGVGIDLFDALSLEGKATYLMASKNRTSLDKGQLLFGVSFGLYF